MKRIYLYLIQLTIRRTIIAPLVDALYADSATLDVKLLNPELISQVRDLEERIAKIKLQMGHIGKQEETGRENATKFVKKWTSIEAST